MWYWESYRAAVLKSVSLAEASTVVLEYGNELHELVTFWGDENKFLSERPSLTSEDFFPFLFACTVQMIKFTK